MLSVLGMFQGGVSAMNEIVSFTVRTTVCSDIRHTNHGCLDSDQPNGINLTVSRAFTLYVSSELIVNKS